MEESSEEEEEDDFDCSDCLSKTGKYLLYGVIAAVAIPAYLFFMYWAVYAYWNSLGSFFLFVFGFQGAKWELRSCRIVDAGIQSISLNWACPCEGPDCKPCPLQAHGCFRPRVQDNDAQARRLVAVHNTGCTSHYTPWALVEVVSDGMAGKVQTCASRYGVDEFGCASPPDRKYGTWMGSIGLPISWHMLSLSWNQDLDSARSDLKAFEVYNDQGATNVNGTVKCWELAGEDIAVRFAPPDDVPSKWGRLNDEMPWVFRFCLALCVFTPFLCLPGLLIYCMCQPSPSQRREKKRLLE